MGGATASLGLVAIATSLSSYSNNQQTTLKNKSQNTNIKKAANANYKCLPASDVFDDSIQGTVLLLLNDDDTCQIEASEPSVGSTSINAESNPLTFKNKIYGYTLISIDATAFQNGADRTNTIKGSVDLTACTKLTSIGSSAFAGTELTEIMIPSNITSIGDDCFAGCNSISSVYFYREDTSWLSSSWSAGWGNSNPITFNVPYGTSAQYYSILYEGGNIPTGSSVVEMSQVIHKGYATDFFTGTNVTGIVCYTEFNDFIQILPADDSGSKTAVSGTDLKLKPEISFDQGNSYYEVSKIEDSAFADANNKIKGHLDLGECTRLFSIGASAFSACGEIEWVTIPKNVAEIGGSAFDNCTNLTTFTFLNSEEDWIEKIDSTWIDNDANVSTFYVPEGTADKYTMVADQKCSWFQKETMRFTSDSECFSASASLFFTGSGTVKGTVCYKKTGVNTIAIVQSDGQNNAKTDVTGWDLSLNAKVTIDDVLYTVTEIDDNAFSGNTGINGTLDLNSAKSITSIGENAFSDCTKITSVNLPAGSILTNIGDKAFFNVPLTDILLGGEETGNATQSYSLIGFTGPDGTTVGKALVPYTSSNEWTPSSYAVGSLAYGKVDLSNVANLKNIQAYTFEGCGGLTSVSFPDTVINIEGGALENCNNLESIEFASSNPAWMSNIDNSWLKGTSDKKNITFYVPEETAKTYTEYAYSLAEKDPTNCWFNPLNMIFMASGSVLETASAGTFFNGGATGNVTYIKNGSDITLYNNYRSEYETVNTLKGYDLTLKPNITIGEETDCRVVSISKGAFATNDVRGDIDLSQDTYLTSIGAGAFYGCSKLTTVNLPNSLNSIEDLAFSGCPISDFTVESGGEYQAYQPNAEKTGKILTSVKTTTWTNYSEVVGSLACGDIDLSQCTDLTSISGSQYFDGTKNTAESNSFEYTSITNITLPSSLKTIGQYAFYKCTNLSSIDLSNNDSLNTIGDSAFEYCEQLESVTLAPNMQQIGAAAFGNCTNINSITFSGTDATWLSNIDPSWLDNDVKSNATTKIAFYVPDDALDSYKAYMESSACTWFDSTNMEIDGYVPGSDNNKNSSNTALILGLCLGIPLCAFMISTIILAVKSKKSKANPKTKRIKI